MERNKKRELQVKIFRFFVPDALRKPLKNFVYEKRRKFRFRKFLWFFKEREFTPDLIVTLTSFPDRTETISETLVSLLQQSIRPEKLVLWLATEQFPQKEKNLPKDIVILQNYGLEIMWCEDLKSYKKLIPALSHFPDKLLVTADDDIYYPKHWLKGLYDSYLKEPTAVHCHRMHRITFSDSNEILPYQKWDKCLISGSEKENDLLFFTTGGGVLFPPDCFYKDVLRRDLFLELCPLADDIWFWAMVKLHGTEMKLVKDNVYRIRNNGNTQDSEPLWKKNREAGENDRQLQAVLKFYGEGLLRKD